ncbi:MAG: hypothetical protein R8G60_13100 [Roseovarius pacificus]|nr:hypothetical protein [Roseovarius pacificus]
MLNEECLNAYMNTFLGYGDFNADTWFVGMEERGGNSLQDIQTRIGTWTERGRRVLEDCAEYHQAIGVEQLFTPPVRVAQPTWDWLMRAQLMSEGMAHGSAASKAMQGERWLRSGSKTCAIELLPLPSPSTGVWHYNQFSNDPVLRNRKSYKAAMLPIRIAAIQSAIDKYKPRNVVFYGKGYDAHWKQIMGVDFVEDEGLRTAQSDDTLFISAMHPTAPIKGTGKKIAYWEKIGARMAGAERPL